MLSRAFFLRKIANVASFLRKEIQAAVREEVSRVMNSTATRTWTNSTSTLSTGATATENSRNSSNSAPSSIQQNSSERTLSFEEFYALREEERQEGFKSPKKRKKKTPSSKEPVAAKVVEVEVKVGIASLADGVFKGGDP